MLEGCPGRPPCPCRAPQALRASPPRGRLPPTRGLAQPDSLLALERLHTDTGSNDPTSRQHLRSIVGTFDFPEFFFCRDPSPQGVPSSSPALPMCSPSPCLQRSSCLRRGPPPCPPRITQRGDALGCGCDLTWSPARVASSHDSSRSLLVPALRLKILEIRAHLSPFLLRDRPLFVPRLHRFNF